MTRRWAAVAALVGLAGGLLWWRGWYSGEEREIRATLAALAGAFNQADSGATASLARAARIGSYFAPDVVVDLGPGSGHIQGRETLVGMAARLQPRTAAFRAELDDIGVELSPERQGADVTLTVLFVRRNPATDEESSDAREFVLQMKKASGRWQIYRAAAIDTFR